MEHAASTSPKIPVAIKGIEPASSLADSAKRRFQGNENVDIESCAFQDIPEENNFDLIYLVDVVQHFERKNHKSLFSKSHALLAPGGSIVVIDKEKYSYYSLKMKVKRRIREVPDYYKTADYPSFRRLISLGRKSGFELSNMFQEERFRILTMTK